MTAQGSRSGSPKSRAEAARFLRTWPHQSQNITLFVKKIQGPPQTEGDRDLALPFNGRSGKDYVTEFSYSKGGADLLGNTVK